MTDTTKTKLGQCELCDSLEHTTTGHVGLTTNGQIDGGSAPASTNGQIDGGAPPKG